MPHRSPRAPATSLRTAIVVVTAASMGALVFALWAVEGRVLDEGVNEMLSRDLSQDVDLVERARARGEELERAVERIGGLSGSRLTVMDAVGQVVADTALDAPELAAAVVYQYPEPGETRTYVAPRSGTVSLVRTLDDGTVIRAQRPALATRAQEAAHSSVRTLLLIGVGVSLLVGVLMAWVLTRVLVRPAQDLTLVADRLAAGDLSARSRSRRTDELGLIGRALDRLAQQLQERESTMRAQEDRMTTILDSMVEGVFVTNEDGTIDLTNDALDDLVDIEPLGRSVIELIRDVDLHEAVLDVSDGGAGRAVAFEQLVDGQVRHFVAQIANLEEGGGAIGVVHDVTRRTVAEQVRTDFVANASHELRTPITAIRGYAETLIEMDDPAMRARFLGVILRHARRLEALVDDMVTLSRAESERGEMKLGPVDLRAAVDEVVEGLSGTAAGKGIEVETDGLDEQLVVWGNERGVDQVLINLVDNAIKYAPEHGRVVVEAERIDGVVQLSVCNDGPGISARHAARIFERFYRVDEGRSRDVGGTGLGLAIVKHLVARMGGEIEVRSRPGETRFTLTLPVEGPALGPRQSLLDAAPPG